ncbi:hypothetical protein GCM10007422_15550 [Pedobacter zeae]|uniref:Uncharacterized protein n=1 Tax=Pedobacter zeae TaxID=1737356 RepID=A0ABQ1XS17_9SPHI|nr:hypothetical protein GCM10007422_15550 [Pedobacter zeae]
MKRITDLKSTRKTMFVFRSQKAANAGSQKTDPTTSTVTAITTLTTQSDLRMSIP